MPIWVNETIEHGLVYGNLAIGRGKDVVALHVEGWPYGKNSRDGGWPSDSEFSDNLCLGLEGGIPLWVDEVAASQHNRFDHDLVFSAWGGPLIWWGGGYAERTVPGKDSAEMGQAKAYASLADFQRETGQERHGLAVDPKLSDQSRVGIWRLPLKDYRLSPGSLALSAGQKVHLDPAWLKERAKYLEDTGAEAYGIPMQPGEAQSDYWGNELDPVSASIGPEK
jgi:hypothetical protein